VKITFKAHGHLVGRFGFKERPLEFEGSTVGDLLLRLQEVLGEEKAQVLFRNGELSDLVYVLVNGRNIEQIKGTRTELKDGDQVSVLPLMAGG
jgi:MoaD family protein